MNMIIRYIEPQDVEQIDKIYETYFSGMERPDFSNFHCVFVVVEDNRVISVGGLKPLVEAVVLTDRSFSVRKRRDALLNIHTGLTYAAKKLGFERIYAFCFEQSYSNHLINRMKFKPIKESNLLTLELKDG